MRRIIMENGGPEFEQLLNKFIDPTEGKDFFLSSGLNRANSIALNQEETSGNTVP